MQLLEHPRAVQPRANHRAGCAWGYRRRSRACVAMCRALFLVAALAARRCDAQADDTPSNGIGSIAHKSEVGEAWMRAAGRQQALYAGLSSAAEATPAVSTSDVEERVHFVRGWLEGAVERLAAQSGRRRPMHWGSQPHRYDREGTVTQRKTPLGRRRRPSASSICTPRTRRTPSARATTARRSSAPSSCSSRRPRSVSSSTTAPRKRSKASAIPVRSSR